MPDPVTLAQSLELLLMGMVHLGSLCSLGFLHVLNRSLTSSPFHAQFIAEPVWHLTQVLVALLQH